MYSGFTPGSREREAADHSQTQLMLGKSANFVISIVHSGILTLRIELFLCLHLQTVKGLIASGEMKGRLIGQEAI